MKKENFIALLFGTIGGLLFSIGMCMCLIPEWRLFNEGCIFTSLGAISLLALIEFKRTLNGKSYIKVNWKIVGKVSYIIFSLLVFGTGMSIIMVFKGLILPGIMVGVIGIILLLFIIPMIKGLY